MVKESTQKTELTKGNSVNKLRALRSPQLQNFCRGVRDGTRAYLQKRQLPLNYREQSEILTSGQFHRKKLSKSCLEILRLSVYNYRLVLLTISGKTEKAVLCAIEVQNIHRHLQKHVTGMTARRAGKTSGTNRKSKSDKRAKKIIQLADTFISENVPFHELASKIANKLQLSNSEHACTTATIRKVLNTSGRKSKKKRK
jgi:hypothetical protein